MLCAYRRECPSCPWRCRAAVESSSIRQAHHLPVVYPTNSRPHSQGDVRKLYTVAQRVAEGNYGTVFKATSKKTGGVVAYKLIENIEKVRACSKRSQLARTSRTRFHKCSSALLHVYHTLQPIGDTDTNTLRNCSPMWWD